MKKRNPIIIGVVGICLILLEVGGYTLYRNSMKIEKRVETKDMSRESTVDFFDDPMDVAVYILEAYQDEDMDKMLRGCAIGERARGISATKIADGKGSFSVNEDFPPSGNYWEYMPYSQTRILAEYIQRYHAFEESASDISGLSVLRIDYYNAALQNESENVLESKRECELWGAQDAVDMVAMVSIDGQKYLCGFRMMKYGGNWKLFSQKIPGGQAGEEEILLRPVEEEEYLNYVSDEEDEALLLERILVSDSEEEDGEKEETKEELLPLNYTLYGREFGKTPEETIENFYVSIRKQDVEKAICYGANEELKEDNLEGYIDNQKEFERQFLILYYHLLYRDIQDEFTLDSVGMTGRNLIEWLAPGMLKYLEYEGCSVTAERENGEMEYLVFLKYNGEHIITGCTLKETEEGWQILSLSAEGENYAIGEVR